MPARYDIFLSYRRADSERVAPLRDELRRLGYRVFFDIQSIEFGDDDWKKRVLRSITESRTLLLCWSESASQSPIVTFEYSSARALRKPVMPWLLDHTPLPVMLNNINGIHTADPIAVAAALRPKLGWTLTRRRILQYVIASLLLVAIVLGLWRKLHPPPPPPWDFHGEVTDRITRMPIPGVEVDLTNAQGTVNTTTTDAHGQYGFHLPQPQPPNVLILFRKEGYEPDKENVPTSHPFDTDLAKLP